MRSRPGVLIFLAIAQLFAPIFSIILSAYVAHLSPLYYFRIISHINPLLVFVSYFLPPLLIGIAIFSIKKWSIPICVLVTVWNIVDSMRDIGSHPKLGTLLIIFAAHLSNLILIGYFLLPAVRKVYHDRKLRWWESKPRYLINSAVQLKEIADPEKSHSCHMDHISTVGAFLRSSDPSLSLGDRLKLEFNFDEVGYSFVGRISNQMLTDSSKTIYGFQFVDMSFKDRIELMRLTHSLDRLGIERKPERPHTLIDFRTWFLQLVTTGQGIFPSAPASRSQLRSSSSGEPSIHSSKEI